MLPTDDYRDLADSDVVVVTVGANIKAGQPRLEVLGQNADLIRSVMGELDNVSREDSNTLVWQPGPSQSPREALLDPFVNRIFVRSRIPDKQARPRRDRKRYHPPHASASLPAAYFYTKILHTLLFWAAFILTRPLGATLGDLLDKPHDHGGLEISRYVASGI